MKNKYPGNCLRCGTLVEAGAGFFQRMNGRWFCRCRDCVGKGNAPVTSEKTSNV